MTLLKISRGNRRGTGPVDLDALNNAMSISSSSTESPDSQSTNDQKVTRVTVSMKERPGETIVSAHNENVKIILKNG